MTTELRKGLPPLPARMRYLPLNRQGYPVPYFVSYIDGEPDFRVLDTAKLVKAVKEHRCWLCGDALGVHRTFVIGPMCSINRVSAEPPCHHDCAEFAAQACPFLLHPKAVRREANLPEDRNVAGIMIERNPGVTLLWTTRTYKPERVGDGLLFFIGDPSRVQWWREGRFATRVEAADAIASGLPILTEQAHQDGPKAIAELERMTEVAMQFLPVDS